MQGAATPIGIYFQQDRMWQDLMWHSNLADVQINHGSTVFLAEWKYLHICYFDPLSVPQQMSHSSVPCKHCLVRGEPNTETQRGSISECS